MNICSNCKKPLDANTSAKNDDALPTAGAVSICFYCGQVCVFEADLTLRKMTAEELTDIQCEDPLVFKMITEAVRFIRSKAQLN